jgi:hypothetical protein
VAQPANIGKGQTRKVDVWGWRPDAAVVEVTIATVAISAPEDPQLGVPEADGEG